MSGTKRFTDFIELLQGSFKGRLSSASLTANRNVVLPDADGTIALISNIPASIASGVSGDLERFWDAEVMPNTSGGDIYFAAAGGSVIAISPDENKRNGIASLTTNVSATGRIFVGSQTTWVVGDGETTFATDIKTPTLSTATDRFQCLIGMLGTTSSATQNNSVHFLYDEGGVSTGSTASPNWQLVCCNGAARTYVTTSIPVSLNWVNLKILINSNGTSASFFINGVSVGVVTLNIPTGATKALAHGVLLIKTISTNPRTVNIDWLYYKRSFVTNRDIPGLVGSNRLIVGAPSSIQVLTGLSQINPNATTIQISATANTTLLLSAQIAPGIQGQLVRIFCTGSFEIAFSEGNGLFLNGTLRLKPGRFAVFQYIGTTWSLQLTNGDPVWTPLAISSPSFSTFSGADSPAITKEGITGLIKMRGGISGSHSASGQTLHTLPVAFATTTYTWFPSGDVLGGQIGINGQAVTYFSPVASGTAILNYSTIQYMQ